MEFMLDWAKQVWIPSSFHMELIISWPFHMESKVTMEPANGWDLTWKSFHMDSMEWGVDSMDSIWIPYGLTRGV